MKKAILILLLLATPAFASDLSSRITSSISMGEYVLSNPQNTPELNKYLQGLTDSLVFLCKKDSKEYTGVIVISLKTGKTKFFNCPQDKAARIIWSGIKPYFDQYNKNMKEKQK